MTEHVTARIEDQLARQLDEPGRNKSETIELALKQYFNSHGRKEGMLQLRLEQVTDDIETLEAQLETKRERRDHLQALLDDIEQEQQAEREDTLTEAIARFDVVDLASVDGLMVDASDEDLKSYADELDITVADLRQRIIHGSEMDA